ncbi:polyphosphate kinase, component of RNA degradosome [Acetoanaerobium sticklandii]|uniref:Polyphosphate kinase n=1 Tax=Acetoanaerobium sticklandii (strain ATCC 12662 / DSM 519 / JCM 1433 / CCUG 9281 / NCIMB 10654 / HF) TaxID=499177 RepID=E3PX66_ACESD|nr:RNA degradosome polyphosphate kinase [Acetoanaerobium sticklandii]CBH21031.1 polyphosphate kinase, component of RNA degradosome [Acetoanaerobium sticklandii]
MTNNTVYPFFNRELSWLEFNTRVLEEAQDLKNPLFERLKFLAITASNLDEFFMVRVASLNDQIIAGYSKKDSAGLLPKEQLDRITLRVHELVSEKYNTYLRSLIPALKKEDIYFKRPKNLTDEQRNFVEKYFFNQIYPVLTPMVVDKSRPFPLILNKSLNIAILLRGNEDIEPVFATVQVPSVLDRFILLPCENDKKEFILLEDIIKIHMDMLFIGHEILDMACYRITRNADLSIDEDGAEDLLEEIEQSIKKRKWGNAVRLEYEKNTSQEIIDYILEESEAFEGGMYRIGGPLDLTFLMKFYNLKGYQDLKFENQIPLPSITVQNNDIFEAISERDIMLHHPFESFDTVVDFVRQAADDDNVLAIKQTLYRVSGNSPIISALAKAAENGKQVTVLVELKARFDEENNIIWAKQLEKAGCHVIYGLVGLKTHCKLLLVVRREEDKIKRYVHMGTGNYNDVTAKFYTDTAIMTCNPYIGADASAVFNMLSGFSQIQRLEKLDIAPVGLRKKIENLIKNEIRNAKEGFGGQIIFKMNSLVDESMIRLLYEASEAGVNIKLIIRGICCLVPEYPQVSENIEVKSIVGKLLEHSRIFYFYNAGQEKIFMSSADLMPRNLDRRVELLFPVEDECNKARVKNIINLYLSDTDKTRILHSTGVYSRVDKRGKEPLNVQDYFYDYIKNKIDNRFNFNEITEFKPRTYEE